MEALKAANVPPNPLSRSMAMVHVAMSDAVNSVQGRYARYAATFPAAPGASAEAAAASAARHMLLRLYPSQKDRIEEAYAGSLKAIADGPAKNDGPALGEQVAGIIYADRSTDAPDTYRPITTPGVWIPTTLPSFAEYGQAKPWVMTVPGGNHDRRGSRRARIGVWQRTGQLDADQRRRPIAAGVQQHRADGRRDSLGANLGRCALQEFAAGQ